MAGLYLTYKWSDEHQCYIAVITEGHFRRGDEETVVLDVEKLPSPRACRKWFKRMRKERPWETRE